MASERVQKILSQTGITSRRKAEEMISLGQVTINGKLAKLGDKADLQNDAIKVAGKLLKTKEAPVYIAFFKPRGVISALSDPDGRASLREFTSKIKARVYPVGRLDFNSEGLLILTNDGDFAEKLQKKEGVPRVYHVKVRGRPEAAMITKLEKGARIGNRLIKPHSVRMAEELANKVWIEVVFTDPGALDIKTLFEQRGFLVENIRRTAIGQVTLRGLEPGEFRYLKASQVEAILDHPELGLWQLPDEGRIAREGEGFAYRSPTGKRGEEAERAIKAAMAAGLPTPLSLKGIKGAVGKTIKPLAPGQKAAAPRKSSYDSDERAPRASSIRAPREGAASRGPRSSMGAGAAATRSPRTSAFGGASASSSRSPRTSTDRDSSSSRSARPSSFGGAASRGPRPAFAGGASRGTRPSSATGASRGPRPSADGAPRAPKPSSAGRTSGVRVRRKETGGRSPR